MTDVDISEFRTMSNKVNASVNRGKADSMINKGIGGNNSNSIKEMVSSESSNICSPRACAPEHSNILPEKLEAKQFPSLAAMALIGKSVNNFRLCEFQRRGATNVWNTGEC